VALLKRGREQVGEEPDGEGQRELHEGHHHEEGQRDHPQQVGQHPHKQVVLSPRERDAAEQTHQQLPGNLGVGGEQLGAVPVVQRRLASHVPRPARRPPRGRTRLLRLLRRRRRAQHAHVLLQGRPARPDARASRKPPARAQSSGEQLPLRRQRRPQPRHQARTGRGAQHGNGDQRCLGAREAVHGNSSQRCECEWQPA
jgi:hypothetical protein